MNVRGVIFVFTIGTRKFAKCTKLFRRASIVMLVACLLFPFHAAVQAQSKDAQSQSAADHGQSSEDGATQNMPSSQKKPPSPEQKMSQRFPQPVKVSFLIGLPMLDENNSTLGRIESVQRTPDGKNALVIGYGGFLGFRERPVGVPVELVAMLGHDVAAVDMPSEKFKTAPSWVESMGTPIDRGETILVAVTKRSL